MTRKTSRAQHNTAAEKHEMPFITETEARACGAKFTKRLPFTPYVVQDGHIITGQNPMSGGRVATLLLNNLTI